MHSHGLARAIRTSSLVMFFVVAETFAQVYAVPTFPTVGQIPSGAATGTAVSPAGRPTGLVPTVTDLRDAGFTDAVALTPSGSAFLPPVSYFRVAESVSDRPEWGSTADLVAVSVTSIVDPTWAYNGGQMQVVDISGRTQARLSRPYYYIVVTGPEANAVVALAATLKEKSVNR